MENATVPLETRGGPQVCTAERWPSTPAWTAPSLKDLHEAQCSVLESSSVFELNKYRQTLVHQYGHVSSLSASQRAKHCRHALPAELLLFQPRQPENADREPTEHSVEHAISADSRVPALTCPDRRSSWTPQPTQWQRCRQHYVSDH